MSSNFDVFPDLSLKLRTRRDFSARPNGKPTHGNAKIRNCHLAVVKKLRDCGGVVHVRAL
jgi:hypothetical protein